MQIEKTQFQTGGSPKFQLQVMQVYGLRSLYDGVFIQFFDRIAIVYSYC